MVFYWKEGYKAPTIAKLLQKKGITGTRRGIHKFLTVFAERRTVERRIGSGRLFKGTATIREEVERVMQEDDEATATQLHQYLTRRGHNLSIRTILRCRTALGWTFRGSAYCQLICSSNKEKRLEWAWHHLHEGADGFLNVIWTDECMVQLEAQTILL